MTAMVEAQKLTKQCGQEFTVFTDSCNWRVSEASETLSGGTNSSWCGICVYICVWRYIPCIHNVGGVTPQPFMYVPAVSNVTNGNGTGTKNVLKVPCTWVCV